MGDGWMEFVMGFTKNNLTVAFYLIHLSKPGIKNFEFFTKDLFNYVSLFFKFFLLGLYMNVMRCRLTTG